MEALEFPEEMGLSGNDTRKGGSHPKGAGMFLKVVVQVVLILGAETRVMIPRIGRFLGGFQHRVA